MAISNKDADTFDWILLEWLPDYQLLFYTFEEAYEDSLEADDTTILNHKVIHSTLLKELYGRA